ncbi:MAG TPA: AlkA N-terminal domain-containing protein, partial [Steroidobacteraceae bacterium]|nr:AlkA N-terminal domain-containing protein [Steroidobacteraceae bacterium]
TAGNDEQVSLTLAYRPPYDWGYVSAFLGRRAICGVEEVSASGYARTIRLARGHARLHVAPMEGEHALRLQVSCAEPGDLFEIATTARRVFDLTADPAAIAAVLSADPVLRPLVIAGPGLRIPGVWDAFECAVRGVLGERLSVRAARRLTERLVQRFGERVAAGAHGLTHVFPSAARLAEADLTTIGLTPTRSAAVRALARAVRDRSLNLSAHAEEVVRALGAVPGVSAWVVQYVALRALGEPDAFPGGDRWLRRLSRARRSPPRTVAGLERRARAWRPWRGYATLYLWRRADGDAAPR